MANNTILVETDNTMDEKSTILNSIHENKMESPITFENNHFSETPSCIHDQNNEQLKKCNDSPTHEDVISQPNINSTIKLAKKNPTLHKIKLEESCWAREENPINTPIINPTIDNKVKLEESNWSREKDELDPLNHSFNKIKLQESSWIMQKDHKMKQEESSWATEVEDLDPHIQSITKSPETQAYSKPCVIFRPLIPAAMVYSNIKRKIICVVTPTMVIYIDSTKENWTYEMLKILDEFKITHIIFIGQRIYEVFFTVFKNVIKNWSFVKYRFLDYGCPHCGNGNKNCPIFLAGLEMKRFISKNPVFVPHIKI